MRERIKETVPEIRRRAEKDKRFLDWKPEQEETHVSGVRPEMTAEVKAVPPAGNRGLRFDEWAEENQSSRKSVSAAPLPKRAAVPSLAAGPAGIEAEDRPVSTHRSGRFGGQEDRPASGSIAGTAGEPGKTEWTGRLRPGWSVDDLLPRETVEAARIPESYRSILQEPDYRENSGYVPSGNGKGRYDPFLNLWTETGYDDPVYEYINGNTDAINKQFSNESVTGRTLMGTDSRFLQNLNETEKGVYNYIHLIRGKDAADRFLSELQGELNARQRKKEETYWAEEAEKHPVNMSVFSTLTKPLSVFSYAQQAEKVLSGEKLDLNAGYNRGSYTAKAIRGAVSREIENSGKWGKAGSYGYNLALSMGDFLYTSAVTGGMEPLALAVMGTEAAADSVLAAKERGLSDERSFITGTVAGVIEAATEHIGFDALFKTGVRSLGKAGFRRYILQNAGAEAAEEGASDLLNWIIDDLYDLTTGTTESEFKQLVAVYEENGLDRTKALLSALGDRGKELGLDILGGFLSGLFLSGAKSGYNAVQFNRMGQEAFDTGSYRDYISLGLLADHNTEAYRYAEEIQAKLNAGRKVTNIEMGQLTAAVYADALRVGKMWSAEVEEDSDGYTRDGIFTENDDSAYQRAIEEELRWEEALPDNLMEDMPNEYNDELNRRIGNTGVFASLPERMSKKHMRAVAKEFDISIKGIIMNIDSDPEKMTDGFFFTGRADPQSIGRIDFFPKAFSSKEELVRTLYHEKIHVQQFRDYGAEYVQNNRAYFEDLAYQAENEFILRMKELGLL